MISTLSDFLSQNRKSDIHGCEALISLFCETNFYLRFCSSSSLLCAAFYVELVHQKKYALCPPQLVCKCKTADLTLKENWINKWENLQSTVSKLFMNINLRIAWEKLESAEKEILCTSTSTIYYTLNRSLLTSRTVGGGCWSDRGHLPARPDDSNGRHQKVVEGRHLVIILLLLGQSSGDGHFSFSFIQILGR